MSLVSLGGFTALKRRPKAYKARDAAYTVGGHGGFYIASRPKKYPKTPQQVKVGRVAAECGIHKGIKKADLQTKMVDCVSAKMRK